MRSYDVPQKHKGKYRKALAGKISPREAIKIHCFHCYGWNTPDAKRCNNTACPLWHYSPAAKILNATRKSGKGCTETQNKTKGGDFDAE